MELRFENLSYAYRKKTANALTDVTATFGPGIHLLLGPNGAGKSTMLRVAAGLLVPQSGKSYYGKEVMACHSPHAVQHIFLLENDCTFPLATVRDMVALHAPFYPSFSREMLERALSAFGMTGDEKFAEMSLGDRHRANISYALALNTQVLMLDEPANGLDMEAKQALAALIASVASDRCIIIATHTVQEMKNLFDSVTVLSRGEVVFSASTAEITRRMAFIPGVTKHPDALCYLPNIEGPSQVVRNDGSFDTSIDYTLLYLAATGENLETVKTIMRCGTTM